MRGSDRGLHLDVRLLLRRDLLPDGYLGGGMGAGDRFVLRVAGSDMHRFERMLRHLHLRLGSVLVRPRGVDLHGEHAMLQRLHLRGG